MASGRTVARAMLASRALCGVVPSCKGGVPAEAPAVAVAAALLVQNLIKLVRALTCSASFFGPGRCHDRCVVGPFALSYDACALGREIVTAYGPPLHNGRE